jgi:amino-acid N-acetyltransferase
MADEFARQERHRDRKPKPRTTTGQASLPGGKEPEWVAMRQHEIHPGCIRMAKRQPVENTCEVKRFAGHLGKDYRLICTTVVATSEVLQQPAPPRLPLGMFVLDPVVQFPRRFLAGQGSWWLRTAGGKAGFHSMPRGAPVLPCVRRAPLSIHPATDIAILQGAAMIRFARPDDIPAILALIHQNNDRLLERSSEEIQALLPAFWVAEEEGEVVGCCCLEIYSRKIAEVRSLVVREDRRHHGLGRRLVQEAVNEARRREIREILTVTSEVGFFASLHFRPVLNEKYALFWSAEAEADAVAVADQDAN